MEYSMTGCDDTGWWEKLLSWGEYFFATSLMDDSVLPGDASTNVTAVSDLEQKENGADCLESKSFDEAWEKSVSRLLRRKFGDVGTSASASARFCVKKDETVAPLHACQPTSVRLVRQKDSWDCGVACLQMVLEWLSRGHSEPIEREDLFLAIQTRSVWTVDLVLLLDRFISNENVSASYLFCSTALGVNENLEHFRYYEKAFDADRERVLRIFETIASEDLPVLRHTALSLERVLQLIELEHCVAIALIDNSILTGKRRSGGSNTDRETYSGHYIVLVGICPAAGCRDAPSTAYSHCLAILNPGCDEQVSYMSFELFERAWRSQGTDQDIIFVAKHPS